MDQKTIDSLRDIVAEKMQNRECFFLLDVTNAAKMAGYKTTPPSNFGSHSDMRPHAESAARAFAPTFGYEWALLDVKSGNEQAWLYFPSGTTTAQLQTHVNRPLTPLIPVEVWARNVSQQATGIQSQATLGTTQTQTVTNSQTQTANPTINVTVSSAQTQVTGGKISRLGQHITRLLGGK